MESKSSFFGVSPFLFLIFFGAVADSVVTICFFCHKLWGFFYSYKSIKIE